MDLKRYLDWPDWQIDQVEITAKTVLIQARLVIGNQVCPQCGQLSTRVHSYYQRHITDLPLSAKAVQIELAVRRFRCLNEACSKMTFSERQADFLPVYARRTKRLSQRLGQVGIALGGEATVDLLPHLRLSGSRDTILRRLRRDFVPATVSAATVVGIDDWAKRKGLKYGAIVVDLESGDVLDLLPDRSPEVIADWLKQRPEIEIVSRDRSNQIREGIDQGAPQAIQVADRFHLLQNLTETIYKVIQPKQKLIKDLFKTEATDHFQDQPISNDEPTAADLRRWGRIEQVHRLHETGWTAKAIALELGIHAKTVGRYLRITDFQPLTRQKRPKLLDPYKPYLQQRWAEGCHKAVLLYQEIQAQGYLGKRTQLQDFLRSLKVKSPSLDPQHLEAVTKWQQLPLHKLAFAIGRPEAAWQDKTWLLTGLNLLYERDKVLAETIDLARAFTQMISQRHVDQLDPWLKQALTAKASPIRRFAASLMLISRRFRLPSNTIGATAGSKATLTA